MSKHRQVKFFTGLIYSAILMFVFGCGLKEISDQANLITNRSSIHGKVEIESTQSGLVYVQLYRQMDQYIELVNKLPLTNNLHYQFDVLSGTYMVGAFVDTDGDTEYQAGEHATYLGLENIDPTPIVLAENKTIDVDTLVIKGPIIVRPEIEIQNAFTNGTKNIGRVVSLDDPMFSRKNASMGFWRPFDFSAQHGGGLMMLQDFEEGKTPVIFVHGISGTSLEFDKIINVLDHEKFQPWVLYYPSGVSLDLISNYFLKALNQLFIKYNFPRVNIIAHSMGGLMIRSFVMKHQQDQNEYQISLVITINSPLYGLDSASMGVKSPIVIPVWRDIASNSDYVKRVHAWRWPKEIPYHLVFSFLPKEEGDGVVPLKSQLSLTLQDEAVRIHGFQAQHAKILKDPKFIQKLNNILSLY